MPISRRCEKGATLSLPSITLTDLERHILDRIQGDFPLEDEPYTVIAAAVGCTPEEAHQAVLALRRRGIIRRIGASFAAKKLGYVSVLVAARVAPDALETVAQYVAGYPEVTHNYERAGHYNLWFTVIAEHQARLDDILATVRAMPGVEALYGLPSVRDFKIRVDFKFGGDADA